MNISQVVTAQTHERTDELIKDGILMQRCWWHDRNCISHSQKVRSMSVGRMATLSRYLVIDDRKQQKLKRAEARINAELTG
jgi:hypothetical protein